MKGHNLSAKANTQILVAWRKLRRARRTAGRSSASAVVRRTFCFACSHSSFVHCCFAASTRTVRRSCVEFRGRGGDGIVLWLVPALSAELFPRAFGRPRRGLAITRAAMLAAVGAETAGRIGRLLSRQLCPGRRRGYVGLSPGHGPDLARPGNQGEVRCRIRDGVYFRSLRGDAAVSSKPEGDD